MIVVDASVALAWVLPDTEEGHAYSGAVAEAAVLHGEQLVAPALLTAECAYALLKTRHRSLSLVALAEYGETIDMFNVALAFPVERVASQVRYAALHKLTAYDAAYLRLAEQTGAQLATLDKGMAAAARAAKVKLFEPRRD